jgi:hypothetical protein
MVLLDSMDWRNRLAFIDLEREWPRATAAAPSLTADQARRTLLVVGPDATLYRGFFAFRQLAGLLPPLWPLWPVLHLPGLDRLGPWIYRLVADGHTYHVRRPEVCRH